MFKCNQCGIESGTEAVKCGVCGAAFNVVTMTTTVTVENYPANWKSEYEVDNALVDQKNEINSLVNHQKYEEALTLLRFVEKLWKALGYGYKVKEVRNRIEHEVRREMNEATHWATRAKWNNILVTI